jgi:Ca2+-binding RTX toxin-like protein
VLGMLAVSPSSIAADPGSTNNLTWSFDSGSQAFDFLSEGQTLTLTYTIKATDDHSSSDTQTVAITITGTNDADPNDFDSFATGQTVTKIGSTVFGTPGADSVAGGGDDSQIVYGGAGNDTINGTGESDIIFAGSGNDTVKGNNDSDTIYGGSGNDTINGNNGNDVIIGGFGADALTGGAGNDTFKFLSAADSQPGTGHFDTITDFTHGSDHLDFTAIAGATQVQANAVAAAGLVDAHSISWFVDSANNQTIVYVNATNTANTVSMEVHLAGTNINLTGADILHHA